MLTGIQGTHDLGFLILKLLCFTLHKINSYWNQYFQPTDSNSKNYQLEIYMPRRFKQFINYIFIPFIIINKIIVDFKHFMVTVIKYLSENMQITLGLSLFLNIFMVGVIVESLITSVGDWYASCTGKKVANPMAYYGLSKNGFTMPIADITARTKVCLNFVNNILESGYTVLLMMLQYPYPVAIICVPFLVGAAFYSSYIKVQVNNMQNIDQGKEKEKTSSFFLQLFTLFLFLIMVISPVAQIQVIYTMMLGVFGASFHVLAAVFALIICLVFVIHKIVQKGDQVFKYLYGIKYDEEGYDLLGWHISGDDSQVKKESFEHLKDLDISSHSKDLDENDLDYTGESDTERELFDL